MKTPYQLPEVPTHALTTTRQQLLVADVSQAQPSLGSRYCHGSYILAWQVGNELVTSAPQTTFDPGIGCGIPWVFERGLGRDIIHDGTPFLRIGCGTIAKQAKDWTQSSGPGFAALPWETTVTEQSIEQRQLTRLLLNDPRHTEIGYDLSIKTTLVDQADDIGFDQEWFLQVQCPWAEPIVGFPHPFGQHGTQQSVVSWDDQQIAVPSEGIFGTYPIDEPRHMNVQYELDGVVRWQCSPSYPVDKVVLYASNQAISAEPYFVRCPARDQAVRWRISYRANLSL